MDNLKVIQRKHEENIYLIDKMRSLQQCFDFIEAQKRDQQEITAKLIQGGDYINVLLYYQALCEQRVFVGLGRGSLSETSSIRNIFGVISQGCFSNF